MSYSVNQLANLAGVSRRTLHFYDEIGLLHPVSYGENGYRWYGEESLMRLQQILFYRELGFQPGADKDHHQPPRFRYVQEALSNHRKALIQKVRTNPDPNRDY